MIQCLLFTGLHLIKIVWVCGGGVGGGGEQKTNEIWLRYWKLATCSRISQVTVTFIVVNNDPLLSFSSLSVLLQIPQRENNHPERTPSLKKAVHRKARFLEQIYEYMYKNVSQHNMRWLKFKASGIFSSRWEWSLVVLDWTNYFKIENFSVWI